MPQGVLRQLQGRMFWWRAGGERKAAETFGENVVATETRIQMRISNLNSTDLFACKWLRARELNQWCWPLKLSVQGSLSLGR